MIRSERLWPLATRALGAGAVLLALAHVALLAVTVFARMRYPFALEWLESGAYDSVARLLEGHALYERPSAEFVAYNYTPLYYELCAPLARAMGDIFRAMRSLSVAATFATLLLAVAVVRAQGARWSAALAAGATLAASYGVTEGFADLARPDALYLLWLALGVYLLTRPRAGLPGALAAGVVFGLAYLTKQSAGPSLVLLLGYLLVRERALGLAVCAALAATAGGGALWFQQATQGWYSYYTLEVATGYHLAPANAATFLARYLGPLAIAVLFGAAWRAWPAEPATRAGDRLLAAIVSIGAGCALLTLYPGTAPNVALPSCFACALLLGLGLDRLLALRAMAAPALAQRLGVLVPLALVLQWSALLYTPARYVPDARDLAAGRELLALLRDVPGDVRIPNHTYLARMAGKPGQAHGMALSNATWSDRRGDARRAAAEIDSAVAQHRYALLVLDADSFAAHDPIPGYGPPVQWLTAPGVFMTRAGTRTRPEILRWRLPAGN